MATRLPAVKRINPPAARFKTARPRLSGSEFVTDPDTFGSTSTSSARAGVQLARFGAGVMGFPMAVLLHELGHFLAFSALGFQGITLRYASVEWRGGPEFWHLIQTGNAAAASGLAEPWKVALAIGAGPATTYVVLVICALLIRRLGPSSLILAVALAAPLRSMSVLPVLGYKLLGHESAASLDESRLATLTGIPETMLLALAVVLLVAGWWLLMRALPRGQRAEQAVPALAGIMAGGPLWLLWLGPWLLP